MAVEAKERCVIDYLNVDTFRTQLPEPAPRDAVHAQQGDILQQVTGLTIPSRENAGVGRLKIRIIGGGVDSIEELGGQAVLEHRQAPLH
jgi:hypothetical protein